MNFNEPTNTLLYKNISLTLYSRKGWCFCGVWEMGGETFTQRENFFPYLLPGAGGANACTPSQACQRCPDQQRPHARLQFSALCPNLTVWFSSCGLLPVTHLFDPSALTRRHLPVYWSKCESLPKHSESLGMNRKSTSYVI